MARGDYVLGPRKDAPAARRAICRDPMTFIGGAGRFLGGSRDKNKKITRNTKINHLPPFPSPWCALTWPDGKTGMVFLGIGAFFSSVRPWGARREGRGRGRRRGVGPYDQQAPATPVPWRPLPPSKPLPLSLVACCAAFLFFACDRITPSLNLTTRRSIIERPQSALEHPMSWPPHTMASCRGPGGFVMPYTQT